MPFSYSTLDDAGRPIRVRWTWLVPSKPDQSALAAWRRLPAYALPPLVVLLGLAAWGLLVWSQGPSVIAVTLFSPISSTLIFAFIALALWQVRCLSRHAASSRATLIARRVCPACSYPLAAPSPPSPPSPTRCPECGGVWNLSAADAPPQIVRVVSAPAPETPGSAAPSALRSTRAS